MQVSTISSIAAVSPSVAHTPGPALCSAFPNSVVNLLSQLATFGVWPFSAFACSRARHCALFPAAWFFAASHNCAFVGFAASASPLQPPTSATTTTHPAPHRLAFIVSLLSVIVRLLCR